MRQYPCGVSFDIQYSILTARTCMSLQQWIVPGVVPNVLVLVICPVNIKLSIQHFA